jgi:large subunit ribosomal protein L35Ae
MTKGTVIQFRRGLKNFKPRHFLIEIPETNTREKASKFVGKKVEWKSTGKEPVIITGKISSAHGNKGVIRAIFEKGLPGQAIGTEIEILTQETKSKSQPQKLKASKK